MKQYMLSVHHAEGEPEPSPEEMQRLYTDVDAFNREAQAAGVMVFGAGLHDPSTATVVRPGDSEVLTTDGPFVESKEWLGGFWIIKAPDLDAALGWAEKAVGALRGPVEVRPLQEDAQD